MAKLSALIGVEACPAAHKPAVAGMPEDFDRLGHPTSFGRGRAKPLSLRPLEIQPRSAAFHRQYKN
jgi:hypothetical protein